MAKMQKRKARPSWFRKQVEKGGKDFLIRKQPVDIQREALSIVRDIVRGNITNKDYIYLFDMKVLENIRLSIFEKWCETNIYYSSMTFVMNVPNGVNLMQNNFSIDMYRFQKLYNDTKNLLDAYIAIINAMDTFILFVQSPTVKSEEDYEQIYSTIYYQTSMFKYII